MPTRLFLFAGFDRDGIIGDSLILYVRTLSKLGDVIVCMDNDCPNSELNKLNKYTIKTIATRHGEYDFGSYKRAYYFAYKKNILKDYDYIYLVNDSVFGPLFDIRPTIKKLESINTDAASIIISKHKTHSYMESWFVRLNQNVFTSKWFRDFMSNITVQPTKNKVTVRYEHGLTNIITTNDCSWGGIYTVHGRFTYNQPRKLFQIGCPFVKRACFTRHYGDNGAKIAYILHNINQHTRNAIMHTSNRIYGVEYMNWFLTRNPLRILIRKLRYAIKKIYRGGI